jgi:uncharacterized membrane protein YtjA (UPF0391 family)
LNAVAKKKSLTEADHDGKAQGPAVGQARGPPKRFIERRIPMLSLALTFLIIALVAGLLGFTGVYVAAAGIAKILFVVFLVLFVISLAAGGMARRDLP